MGIFHQKNEFQGISKFVIVLVCFFVNLYRNLILNKNGTQIYCRYKGEYCIIRFR